MPLIKSGSKTAISQNIREMVSAGHPQNQAVAAALSTARKYRASGGQAYTINKGDTLGALALRFHTTVDKLMALNPQIQDAGKIRAGAKLNISPITPPPQSGGPKIAKQGGIGYSLDYNAKNSIPIKDINPTSKQDTPAAALLKEKNWRAGDEGPKQPIKIPVFTPPAQPPGPPELGQKELGPAYIPQGIAKPDNSFDPSTHTFLRDALLMAQMGGIASGMGGYPMGGIPEVAPAQEARTVAGPAAQRMMNSIGWYKNRFPGAPEGSWPPIGRGPLRTEPAGNVAPEAYKGPTLDNVVPEAYSGPSFSDGGTIKLYPIYRDSGGKAALSDLSHEQLDIIRRYMNGGFPTQNWMMPGAKGIPVMNASPPPPNTKLNASGGKVDSSRATDKNTTTMRKGAERPDISSDESIVNSPVTTMTRGYSLAGGGGTGLPALPKTKGLPPQSIAVSRAASIGMARKSGFLHSSVPGRTDKIGVNVRNGSYVIPADVVSGHGQGNSLAGANALDSLFKSGPYGSARVNIRSNSTSSGPRLSYLKPNLKPQIAQPAKSDGGGSTIPVMAAGGEFIVDPETVKKIGNGDSEHGFRILDKFVLNSRKKHIGQLKKLKPPKKD